MFRALYKIRYRILISALHAFLLIFFTVFCLSSNSSFYNFRFFNGLLDSEKHIYGLFKSSLNENICRDDFFLINTANDNYIEDFKVDGKKIDNRVMVDRASLTKLLITLDSVNVKYIILDLIFDERIDSTVDAGLEKIITKLNDEHRLIMPCKYNKEDNSFSYSIFKCRYGLSQYDFKPDDDYFCQYKLSYVDSLGEMHKQIPILLYEDLNKVKLEHKKMFLGNYFSVNNKLCVNIIIPRIRYTLGAFDTLCYYQTSFNNAIEQKQFAGNKIVIIGDFEGMRGDMHYSIAGMISGPLILMNTIVALQNGSHILSLKYLFFIFMFYFFISYFTFYQKRVYTKKEVKNNLLKWLLRKVINRINFWLVLLLSYVSAIVFKHYIYFIAILSYIIFIEFFMEYILEFVKKYFKRRKTTEAPVTGDQ
ncbi:MAG: CHASE2 domain-containing protein [Bacteroidales bacterium]|nr:CHASE2 domain-containing protein [Bacteroidales bacterium]